MANKKIEDMLVTSTFNLSIPIAQATDRIFGVDENTYIGKTTREKPTKPKKYLYVNVQALISSVIASIDKEHIDKVLASNYQNEILDRVSYEEDIILALSNNANVDVTFYKTKDSDYKVFPFAENRQAKTKTARVALLVEVIFDVIKDKYKELPSNAKDCLVITSHLSDLIDTKSSCDLLLLHTGKRILHKNLNTRLHPASSKADMSAIPFNKTTLKTFGDKGGKIKKVLSSKTRMVCYNRLIGLKINRSSSEFSTSVALKEFIKKIDLYIENK